jgi:hypothetical protein
MTYEMFLYIHCCKMAHTTCAVQNSAGFVRQKGGRKIQSMFHLCLIKDCTVIPLFCIMNPAQYL